MKRSISRIALALALSTGAIGAGVAPAMAQDIKISKEFRPTAAELQQAVQGAKEDAAVTAASQQAQQARQAYVSAREPAAKQQAQAQLTAAQNGVDQALGGIRAKIDAAAAAATKPDDKYFVGQIALTTGQLMFDPKLQKRGIDMMLASGLAPAANVPTYHYFSGALAYDSGDYAGAREALPQAIAAGYTENDVRMLLAESYLADNMYEEGLVKLNDAIEARRTATGQPQTDLVFRGLAVAANNGLNDQAFEWALRTLEASPTADQRKQAYSVVASLSPYTEEEELDLLRLMLRENAISDEGQYLAYLYQTDPRLRPGEARAVANAGIEAGVLDRNAQAVTETLSTANARYDSVLSELNTDAAGARNAATGKDAMTLADIYLGYEKSSEAVALYRVALEKGGVDKEKALTGLGIALADMGQFAEAKSTFEQIQTGNRTSLARAWMAYVDTQMAS
ncbi:hypothetical protein [uncultured Croceicoccus sp.]|uniref:hypothetical protein n=1 Tax=uncultured Croceicoccus sp. TaxID=1295329 RepID=UPI0026117E10|nr:hypothetical protein [uncultured Croceicoccus sp.]